MTTRRSVVDSSWTLSQELLLIEGLTLYGFGSWKLISKHIGTKRDKQCENYYINRYVTGVLRDEQNEEMRLLSSRKSSLFLNEYEKEQDNKKEREIQRKAIKINQLQKKGRIKGYNIARDEFKVEHENDAEKELLGIALGDEEVFRLVSLSLMSQSQC